MTELNNSQLLELFEIMYKIRQFELTAYDLLGQNMIPGTLHTYAGEEAVATGVCYNLKLDDYVSSTHRGHGHCIAKGADINKMMAELFGRETGYCKGKGGSMHIADFKIGMLGANGIVAGGIPLAVGAGLSCKLKYPGRVSVAFFGDGASNQGTFHESINLAAAWELPVVFVCENNLYAMGTDIRKVTANPDIADRAIGYGIDGIIADGMDVLDVYKKSKKAIEKARDGKGPTLIECKTYRIKGHSRYDPASYRPEKEVKKWLEKDAIKTFKNEVLINSRNIEKTKINDIESRVEIEIERAVDFAKESPWPEPNEALTDIYGGD
ncbi:MAG: pyruvate dehydrogenase (acetyl-transferring) E1 component subunit alpha [Candidatus Lokiarchaeota archaeon]|nr:pyruvate dehydrogenase (acetyl-transferring) E1 component subunit alpha [Candidatus Lokiarchaeota archaeon]